MEKLQGMGTVIYLHADYHIIENRVSRNPQRGLAIPQGQTLEDLYRERVPMYRKFAHMEISTQTKNLNQCMHTILEGLNAEEEFPGLKKSITRESK